MSLESWKEEFYPVPADSDTLKTKVQRIQHSLTKWIGVKEENLEKHDVYLINYRIRFDNTDKNLGLNSDSCSLCHFYWDCEEINSECHDCPLAETMNETDNDCGCDDIWDEARQGRPESMIKALTECLEENE